MTETVNLTVGPGLNEQSLLEKLGDFLDKLAPLLTSDVSREGSRATAESDSLELELVENVDGDVYSLAYNYEWSAFYGCRDADNSGTRHSHTQFTYAHGMALFTIIEEEHGTYDEL